MRRFRICLFQFFSSRLLASTRRRFRSRVFSLAPSSSCLSYLSSHASLVLLLYLQAYDFSLPDHNGSDWCSGVALIGLLELIWTFLVQEVASWYKLLSCVDHLLQTLLIVSIKSRHVLLNLFTQRRELFRSHRGSEWLIILSRIYRLTALRHWIRRLLDVSENFVWVKWIKTYLDPCWLDVGWSQCCTPGLIIYYSEILLTDGFDPFAAHVFHEIAIRRLEGTKY